MVEVMDRNKTFEIKLNVDLFVRVKAQAGNDAEYAAMQIIIAKLLKSGVVYKIDPRVISSEPVLEEFNEVKH
jgi:hypothetical protein